MKNVSFNLQQWLHELPQQRQKKKKKKKKQKERRKEILEIEGKAVCRVCIF